MRDFNLKKLINFGLSYKFSILFFSLLFVLGYLLNRQAAFILINVLSLFLVLSFLSKVKYGQVLYYILVFFIACDTFYYVRYSSSIYLAVLSSMLETTPIEAKEMVGDIFLPIVLVICCTYILSILAYKELRNISIKSSKIIIIIAYIFLTFICIPSYIWINIQRNKDVKSIALFKESPLLTVQTIVGQKFPIVYNDLAVLFAYSSERYRINKLLASEKEFPEGLSLSDDHQKETPERIYVIIGESSFRDHYSLYGYNEPTTPFLDSLKQNSSDISFYNGISPACVTRDALRFSLTFATPFNKDAFFKEKNIIDIAKARGYKVLWISNQERIGAFDNYTGMIASQADISYFETRHDLYRNDLSLTSQLKQYNNPSEKQLIFLHLIGSHEPYEYRSDSIDAKAIPQKYTTHITNYDRSIHYTDRVLREVYKTIIESDKSTLLYYFSDHGECIGLGHAQINGGQDQFKTPLILIKHNTDLDTHNILSKYMSSEIDGINNVNTAFILSEILGYDIASEVLNKAKDESRYVYHIDGKIYPYNDIKKK